MGSSYLPGSDSLYLQWLTTFVAYAVANKVPLGISVADAALLSDALDQFTAASAAHETAVNAAQSTRETKDDVRVDGATLVRRVVRQVQANPNVSDAQRRDLGITVVEDQRTPVPPPTAVPALVLTPALGLVQELRVINTSDPYRRARPAGVAAWQVFVKVTNAADPAPVDVGQYALAATATRASVTVTFNGADAGKRAWLIARAVNGKGVAGPAGEPVSVLIAA